MVTLSALAYGGNMSFWSSLELLKILAMMRRIVVLTVRPLHASVIMVSCFRNDQG